MKTLKKRKENEPGDPVGGRKNSTLKGVNKEYKATISRLGPIFWSLHAGFPYS